MVKPEDLYYNYSPIIAQIIIAAKIFGSGFRLY